MRHFVICLSTGYHVYYKAFNAFFLKVGTESAILYTKIEGVIYERIM